MTNIFNLFLFLITTWLCLMLASGHLSWFYFGCGILFSGIITYISFALKLVKKDSELLYFSFGFYYHFIKIFITNFFKSIKLIIQLAFYQEPIKPKVYNIILREEIKFNLALLVASLNMISGLLFINIKEQKISIHTIDKKYLNEFELKQIVLSLNKANDDNLV
jgi:multisubunit Na+/H+ antiporter MnhE subunit